MAHHVYIMTNSRKKALYCGVTDDLVQRVKDHRARRTGAIAHKRHLTHLVWVEEHEDLAEAELRMTEIREMSHKNKVEMVEEVNPGLRCLLAAQRVAEGRALKPFNWRNLHRRRENDVPLVMTPDGPAELVDEKWD